MEVAESILPGSLERTITAFEKQQSHDHKMDEEIISLNTSIHRQEKSDSWKAFTVILLFGAALLYLLTSGKVKEASIFGGFFLGLAALARTLRK